MRQAIAPMTTAMAKAMVQILTVTQSPCVSRSRFGTTKRLKLSMGSRPSAPAPAIRQDLDHLGRRNYNQTEQKRSAGVERQWLHLADGHHRGLIHHVGT